MNERLKKLAEQAEDDTKWNHPSDYYMHSEAHYEWQKKFAELIVAEAFRAGMLYSAKKYAAVGDERFIGNDVALFLEMEAYELSDDDIKQHFGIK